MKKQHNDNAIYFHSLDAVKLYNEFEAIPDNNLGVRSINGQVITASMMHYALKRAYKAKGMDFITGQ